MNKNIFNLLALGNIFNGEYSDLDYEFSTDPLVSDCLMHLYMSLLMNDNDPKKDEYFSKSVELYRSFDDKRQEYIRNDIRKILKAQDENQKKKER